MVAMFKDDGTKLFLLYLDRDASGKYSTFTRIRVESLYDAEQKIAVQKAKGSNFSYVVEKIKSYRWI